MDIPSDDTQAQRVSSIFLALEYDGLQTGPRRVGRYI